MFCIAEYCSWYRGYEEIGVKYSAKESRMGILVPSHAIAYLHVNSNIDMRPFSVSPSTQTAMELYVCSEFFRHPSTVVYAVAAWCRFEFRTCHKLAAKLERDE